MTEAKPEKEMPRYKSHKEVWALKIAKIEPACGDRPATIQDNWDGGAIVTPVEEGYAPFRVDCEYVRKHDPKSGGYHVVYQDGYTSWSPAEAFEGGYTLIEG